MTTAKQVTSTNNKALECIGMIENSQLKAMLENELSITLRTNELKVFHCELITSIAGMIGICENTIPVEHKQKIVKNFLTQSVLQKIKNCTAKDDEYYFNILNQIGTVYSWFKELLKTEYEIIQQEKLDKMLFAVK